MKGREVGSSRSREEWKKTYMPYRYLSLGSVLEYRMVVSSLQRPISPIIRRFRVRVSY